MFTFTTLETFFLKYDEENLLNARQNYTVGLSSLAYKLN